ncbi:MAG TPA: hypothetical protein VFQ99_00960 [Gallionella sp.]|nr:hypothetical protein [Gallionella sp.]
MAKKEPGVADNQTIGDETGVVEESSAALLPQNGAAEAATLDKYHGHGGSYVVDDATQTRRPNK